jgi:3-oxoacyl-[acyl-carrier protein] reductase
MSHSLKGKVALITGGSRGIGAAIAKRLAADGANVAITYARDADVASAVVHAIEAAGGKAIAIKADAAAPEAIEAAVKNAVSALGKLDILVNNAGTAIPKPFEETSLEEIEHVINLNIRGVFVTTQAALKNMNENGRIIMIGSCVGERNLTPGLAAYAATKGAVKMFAQSLSREVGGRGITVNNVQPGPIDTDLNPLPEIGQRLRKPLPRSGATDMWMRSRLSSHLWPARSPPTSQVQILRSMAERMLKRRTTLPLSRGPRT